VRLVSRFRTGDDTVVEMPPRREQPKQVSRSPRAAKSKVASASGGRRNALAADAGWEEF
jgi:methyl-accepting chemotaxis protein